MRSISKELVRSVLEERGPALLKKPYPEKWSVERPTTGYCYVVSEALYHYLPRRTRPFHINLGEGIGVHWFLRAIDDEEVLDYTAEQFDFPVPYANARRGTFFKGSIATTRGSISSRGYEVARWLGLR